MSYIRYQHDCSRCHFLGQHENKDLYCCNQGMLGPTVIARNSDEPSDYESGMYGAFSDGALSRARRLAQAKGLLAYPWKTALHALNSGSPDWAQLEFQEHIRSHPMGQLAQKLLQGQGSTKVCQQAFEQLAQELGAMDTDAFWSLTHRLVEKLAPNPRSAFSAMTAVTEWQLAVEGAQA